MSKANLKKRLTKLEATAKESARPMGRWTEEAWVDWFGGEGARYFVGEPDYAEALKYLRDAIRDAATYSPHDSPPFEPPANYMRGEPLDDRRIAWRSMKTYKKVNSAMLWMFEMSLRSSDGKPPVTEAEFRDLESWFHANENRIPRDGLDVGESRHFSRTNLRVQLANGPRATGVTKLVDDLRLLRRILH